MKDKKMGGRVNRVRTARRIHCVCVWGGGMMDERKQERCQGMDNVPKQRAQRTSFDNTAKEREREEEQTMRRRRERTPANRMRGLKVKRRNEGDDLVQGEKQ